MITYNDWPHIQQTIDSVYDQVDEIIAIDGKFQDFPQLGGNDHSTDGTLEYLLRLPKVRTVVATGLTEVEKRNKYLVGDVGDWYLHLDADEEWVGMIEVPDADMLVTWLKREKPRFMMQRMRLFHHVPGLHYAKKHYWLHDGHNRTFALIDKPGSGYTANVTNETKIIHHEFARTPERHSEKKQYYRALCKIENRIWEEI